LGTAPYQNLAARDSLAATEPVCPQGTSARKSIEAASVECGQCGVRDLPPGRSDFSSIAKGKEWLRKAGERTLNGLWSAIGRFIGPFAPDAGFHI
jgi:hypothetical protein